MSQIRLRLAGYQGPSSILTAGLKAVADKLEEYDKDWLVHVDADVTAQGSKATSLFGSIEQNDATVGYIASGYLGARVADLGILDLPFSVSSRDAALRALDGEAGQLLHAAVDAHTEFKVLGFWDNGFRHISNSVHPIVTAHDCLNLSLRTLDSANYRAALSALGFKAVSTDVKELVRVIESGELQAQENPLTNMLGFSLWKYHRYVSLTGHFFGVLLLACRREWFESLPTHRQCQLQNAVTAATQVQRELAAREDRLALLELRRLGIDVRESHQIDISSMRHATREVTGKALGALSPRLIAAYLSTQ